MKNDGTIFGNQLNERIHRDRLRKDQSVSNLANILSGGDDTPYIGMDNAEGLRHELARICSFFGIHEPERIPYTEDVNEVVDYVTRGSLIMHRRISLDDNWWKNEACPILAVRASDERVFAILTDSFNRHFYVDETGNNIFINSKNNNIFQKEAISFYRPLPYKKMSGADLILFMLRHISTADYLMLFITTIALLLMGTVVPFATNIIFANIIPTHSVPLIASVFMLLTVTAISGYLVSVVRQGLVDRIREKMEVMVENALTGRLINLPPQFFRTKNSGSLGQSVIAVRQLPAIIMDSIIAPGSILLFSVIYIIQIAAFSPILAVPAFIILILQWMVVSVFIRDSSASYEKELQGDMDARGLLYPFITGIQRIRLSGCEDRAVALWAEAYRKKAAEAYGIGRNNFQNEIINAISLTGILGVYYFGKTRGIDVAQFADFLAAFGLLTANTTAFLQSSRMIAYIKPILQMVEPVLMELPEINETRKGMVQANGKIDMNHIYFRYNDDQPYILNDLDLHINPGEYVALVGQTGCGKSTILRLLMGFEEVETGTITYNNRDIKNIDLGFLHRRIGTVLQGETLFTGDILSNITISAPQLGLKEAWEAAEMAGIADDIRAMPMGMYTLISEGSGAISGGQKQRLLIARAIVIKPKILFFDEATSALDNLTQKIVSDSLDHMNCTRIVVAHRLSTIKNCDRIVVIDKGRIIEDGSYDKLMAQNGYFANLVSRQHL